ncbi:MAG: OsmC family protein [Chloroflexi bacterium]|nr:OsmC family protein [Chloroflexota bacterium]
MTLLLYARRKEWPVKSVKVEATHDRVNCKELGDCEDGVESMVDMFRAEITIEGDLTEEQRQRLEKIAAMCRVHKTLTGSPRIEETVRLA